MMSHNDIDRIIVYYFWIGARIRFATEESFALFIPISMAEDFGCRGIFNAEKAAAPTHCDFMWFSSSLRWYFNINKSRWLVRSMRRALGFQPHRRVWCCFLWLHRWLHTCNLSGCAPMQAIWDDQVQRKSRLDSFVQSKWFSDWNGFQLGMAGIQICGAC